MVHLTDRDHYSSNHPSLATVPFVLALSPLTALARPIVPMVLHLRVSWLAVLIETITGQLTYRDHYRSRPSVPRDGSLPLGPFATYGTRQAHLSDGPASQSLLAHHYRSRPLQVKAIRPSRRFTSSWPFRHLRRSPGPSFRWSCISESPGSPYRSRPLQVNLQIETITGQSHPSLATVHFLLALSPLTALGRPIVPMVLHLRVSWLAITNRDRPSLATIPFLRWEIRSIENMAVVLVRITTPVPFIWYHSLSLHSLQALTTLAVVYDARYLAFAPYLPRLASSSGRALDHNKVIIPEHIVLNALRGVVRLRFPRSLDILTKRSPSPDVGPFPA
ncbi:hypothetical protein FPV67DRAFT_1167105 [Lyophyllum atratum]|nr:hypothetical protein FPV67DRAFT_1167105 [Lyophyllum atratum]